ncbi:MAG: RnfH family protein [Gammaproteobacteria bacterium]
MAIEIMIVVEIAYISAEHQEVLSVKMPENCTVEDAINASGILKKCSEIDLAKCSVGIYGKVVKNSQILKDLDRVEIYRPLIIDPMHARRKRAQLQS